MDSKKFFYERVKELFTDAFVAYTLARNVVSEPTEPEWFTLAGYLQCLQDSGWVFSAEDLMELARKLFKECIEKYVRDPKMYGQDAPDIDILDVVWKQFGPKLRVQLMIEEELE